MERAFSLEEAIKFEREISLPVQRTSSKFIDTSVLKPSKLQAIIENIIIYEVRLILLELVLFLRIGYKHGIPKDLDLMFDVRFFA